ncbi:hypothetical protein DE146DRAFT_632484 [Phaeosphaeria sp. MPI-PUGE-AT-0046c]|nr:hypothetical protein DE146DRAFT_632484 [Phaeosphaeria sp. MPI-PUGE-AT-0046c]
MPTEQERPGMFARPQKASKKLQRGPAYDDFTTSHAVPRNHSVKGLMHPNEQNQELSQRRYLVPVSRLSRRAGIAVSTDEFLPTHVSARPNVDNAAQDQTEKHTSGALDVYQQHGQPLRSHPIVHAHTELQTSHHQDETTTLPPSSNEANEPDTVESMVPPAQRADSLIEDGSTIEMASLVELANCYMVNKGPIVLCQTPPPAVRDDELFLGTSPPSQDQGTWSRVQRHPAEVSDAASLGQSLSADIISCDEDESKLENESGETPKESDFQPLVLHLPEGPSLYEEIFGQPLEKNGNTRGNGERAADNLDEYPKYTG